MTQPSIGVNAPEIVPESVSVAQPGVSDDDLTEYVPEGAPSRPLYKVDFKKRQSCGENLNIS